jgi:hypothetical protein
MTCKGGKGSHAGRVNTKVKEQANSTRALNDTGRLKWTFDRDRGYKTDVSNINIMLKFIITSYHSLLLSFQIPKIISPNSTIDAQY